MTVLQRCRDVLAWDAIPEKMCRRAEILWWEDLAVFADCLSSSSVWGCSPDVCGARRGEASAVLLRTTGFRTREKIEADPKCGADSLCFGVALLLRVNGVRWWPRRPQAREFSVHTAVSFSLTRTEWPSGRGEEQTPQLPNGLRRDALSRGVVGGGFPMVHTPRVSDWSSE